ncbi:hypothetical protein ACWDTI_24225 [Gordonia sp. NPDC003424]
MTRRAVVYLYTQTGQLREVAESFTAPLAAAGWHIRWVNVIPREPFPFPWSIRQFFGIFPRAVDPDEVVGLVEPTGGFGADHDTDEDEIVLLAQQVWYLSPSLPIRSLVAGYPELFQNRRVIVLIACRNMWYSATVEVVGLLRAAGARQVEVVAATDTRHQAVSLATTLRWLLTGKRDPFLWFGRAGVGDAELARIAAIGRSLAEQGECKASAAPMVPTLAAADLFAGRLFRRWGVLVRSAGRVGAAAHAAGLVVFVVGVGIGIVVGLPLIGCAALLGGVRFEKWILDVVDRQISFGELRVDDTAHRNRAMR